VPSKDDFEFLKKFARIVDIFRGKVNIKSRLAPLLNPENLQTSSRLNNNQVKFVADAFWLASAYSEFEPLKDYALEVAKTNISLDGKGREEAISFMGAIEQSKVFQALISSRTSEKESPKVKKENVKN
jgi:hypothetical protein